MENNSNNNGNLLKTRSEFDISDSAFACMVFIVFNILFSVLLLVFKVNTSALSELAYFELNVIVEALFALGAVFVAKVKKKNLLDCAGMKKKVNGSIIGLCFLIALVSLFGFGNITNVFVEILVALGYSTENSAIVISDFWQYLAWIFSSCLVAGFCEELLFRGVIESGFKKWGIKVAVGFSALIFMIMHGSALQTVHQLIIGIIIGYVFYKTNNLWLGVFIHLFNNFIPITEAYLLNLLSKDSESAEIITETTTTQTIGIGTILIDFIIAIAVAWAGYYIIKKLIDKLIQKDSKLNNEEANDMVSSIKIDGTEQEIEMSIEGVPAKEEDVKPLNEQERPKISGATIAMFSIAGFYLVIEWLINTISRFM